MKKLFSGLILFLLSGTAFAAANAWNAPGNITPVASHTDLSIAYLAQVFGTVGNSLQGTSGQMLGMMFSKLNEGIMVVAGIWLIYTVITIILRSAMDGSFMGPNKNVFWIVIRIALAFAMLIPGPMTGYNVIQDIVMKVVVQGVSLADQTWNFGLDYIGAGGTLWRTPETTAGGSGLLPHSTAIVSQSQAKMILTPTQNIFNAEVCMVASSIQNSIHKTPKTGETIIVSSGTPLHYHVVETANSFAFPGMGNGKNFSSNIQKNPAAANCGYVNWTDIQGAHENKGTPMLAKAALSQVVYDLLPAAKKYACSNYTGAGGTSVCRGVDASPSDVYPDNQNSVFNSLVNYVNAVYPVAQAAHQGAARMAMRWFSNAEKTGWMVAGRYYWDLSQVQAYEGRVSNIGSYAPKISHIDFSAAKNQNGTLQSFLESSTLTNAWNIYVNGSVSYPNGALSQLAKYSAASHAGDAGGSHASVEAGTGNKILNLLLGPVVGDIVGLFALFGTHMGAFGMGADPILFLHEVGMRCLAIAGDIWIGLGILIFGLSAATMVCQSTLNLDTPLNAVSSWIKPPLMVLAAALLGVGVLLGYYVPLYPFMLFTFGVIGWIISVIEAMVAAPLIAFGLTHPEGHDFLGEAKQGLTLLLGVFLRPVLMVIGLIAGMILSYVSLRILVYTYSGFLMDIFYQATPYVGSPSSVLGGASVATLNIMAGSGSLSGIIMSLFAFPLMLAIFAALVYVVTNQCFSLIYILPDYILRWIGAPTQPSAMSAAQMAGQVQGAMKGMSDTASSGMNQGNQAAISHKANMAQSQQQAEKSGEGSRNEGSTSEHSTK